VNYLSHHITPSNAAEDDRHAFGEAMQTDQDACAKIGTRLHIVRARNPASVAKYTSPWMRNVKQLTLKAESSSLVESAGRIAPAPQSTMAAF
jgi:hypothetical protein